METFRLNEECFPDPKTIAVFLFHHARIRVTRDLRGMDAGIKSDSVPRFPDAIAIVVIFGAFKSLVVQPNRLDDLTAECWEKHCRDVLFLGAGSIIRY